MGVKDEQVERPHPQNDAAHGKEPNRPRDAKLFAFG